MLGDNGGAYQVARGNWVVNPGNVGIGVAGGDHMTVEFNVVDAEKYKLNRVGLSIKNWKAPTISDVVVQHNMVRFIDKNGKHVPYWDPQHISNADALTNSFLQ